jgi:type II secretory pathway component PulK
MTADEFGQFNGVFTTTTGNFIKGLVNVNTASEAVLVCIPGIGPDMASNIVAARQARGYADTNIAWVADTLGVEGATQAGRYITGQSWQVSADIAAVGRHGRGYRRTRFVIDQSTTTPRIIYRRNLAPLGWALGRDVRQLFALQKNIR